MAALNPCVMWAQRPLLVFVTINVSNCENPELKVEKDALYFKGLVGPEKKLYECKLNFFGEIKEDTVKFSARPGCFEFALEKVVKELHWDRLLKDPVKQHWLKIDFSKLKDKDESEEEGEGDTQDGQGDLEQMMASIGGLGGRMGGMPGVDADTLILLSLKEKEAYQNFQKISFIGMGGMPGIVGGMMVLGSMAVPAAERRKISNVHGQVTKKRIRSSTKKKKQQFEQPTYQH